MRRKPIWTTMFTVVLAVCLCGLALPLWAEDGVTDTEVVISAGLDLTGAVASWGVNIKAGMEAMFNRVNEAGGVHGRKIKQWSAKKLEFGILTYESVS